MNNPGLSGAGVAIFSCSPDLLLDAGLHLGIATNNIAELAALFICFSALLNMFRRHTFARAIIFCDSKYAIAMVSSSKIPRVNGPLVNLVRHLHADALSRFMVELHWVKGHSIIGGNARVDALAKHFASPSPSVTFDVSLLPLFTTMLYPWPFGYPLSAVPVNCFVSSTLPFPKRALGSVFNTDCFSSVPASNKRCFSDVFDAQCTKGLTSFPAPVAFVSDLALVTKSKRIKPAAASVSKKRSFVVPAVPVKRSTRLAATSASLLRASPCGFYDTSESLDFKHAD